MTSDWLDTVAACTRVVADGDVVWVKNDIDQPERIGAADANPRFLYYEVMYTTANDVLRADVGVPENQNPPDEGWLVTTPSVPKTGGLPVIMTDYKQQFGKFLRGR